MAEQVAIVEASAAAKRAHELAHLAVDQGVDHHRGTALGAADGQLQVVERLDARVADLLERLIGELGLERGYQARSRLAGRVGDDVELDGLARGHHAAEAIANVSDS